MNPLQNIIVNIIATLSPEPVLRYFDTEPLGKHSNVIFCLLLPWACHGFIFLHTTLRFGSNQTDTQNEDKLHGCTRWSAWLLP